MAAPSYRTLGCGRHHTNVQRQTTGSARLSLSVRFSVLPIQTHELALFPYRCYSPLILRKLHHSFTAKRDNVILTSFFANIKKLFCPNFLSYLHISGKCYFLLKCRFWLNKSGVWGGAGNSSFLTSSWDALLLPWDHGTLMNNSQNSSLPKPLELPLLQTCHLPFTRASFLSAYREACLLIVKKNFFLN